MWNLSLVVTKKNPHIVIVRVFLCNLSLYRENNVCEKLLQIMQSYADRDSK